MHGFLSSKSKQSTTSHPTITTVEQNIKIDTSAIGKVLVIGETGCGKSTFINYLTNYFHPGGLNNLKIAIPSKVHPIATESFNHSENDISDPTKSKTDSCTQYTYKDSNTKRDYMFLDTPGLVDTRGIDQDTKNIVKIIEAVEGLNGLTGIIIVVNGSVARITSNLRSVLASLRGNLPDIILDNVIVLLTNSKRHEANFVVQELKLQSRVYLYYMQNSAFSTHPSTWNDRARAHLQTDWNESMQEIQKMLQTIDTFQTKSVTAFTQMKDIRNQIKTLMHKAKIEITAIQKLSDDIAAYDVAVKQHSQNQLSYKDFTKERIVKVPKLVDASHHSTICSTCNYVCHDRCGLTETTIQGDQIFQSCWAMVGGVCGKCPSKCSYTTHYHAKKTMKVTEEKMQDVLVEIKAKYDTATKNKNEAELKVKNSSDAKLLLQKAMKRIIDDIKQKCNELKAICKGFNLATELYAMIEQLKTESIILTNIEAKQQANEVIRSLTEFCKLLEDNQKANQLVIQMDIINTESTDDARKAFVNNTNQAPHPQNLNSAIFDIVNRQNAGEKKVNTKPLSYPKKKVEKKMPQNEELSDSSQASQEENEEDEEQDPRRPRTSKQQPTKSEMGSTKTRLVSTSFNTLQTSELIAQYNRCKDQHQSGLIRDELTLRSQGKSMSPTSSPGDLANFTMTMNKYENKSIEAISLKYLQLQEEINRMLKNNIMNIESVPNNLLFEIAAVHALFSRKTSEMAEMGRNNTSVESPTSRRQLHQHQQSHSLSNHCSSDEERPSSNHGRHDSSTNRNHARSSGLLSSLVPNDSSPKHALRQNANDDDSDDGSDNLSEGTKNEQVPPSYRAAVGRSASHRSINRLSNISSKLQSTTLLDNDENEKFECSLTDMSATQLLAAHNSARTSNNRSRKEPIYEELRRRCYGESTYLIQNSDIQTMNKIEEFKKQPLKELLSSYDGLKQEIGIITDDEATHIKQIPADWLHKITAMHYVIRLKQKTERD